MFIKDIMDIIFVLDVICLMGLLLPDKFINFMYKHSRIMSLSILHIIRFMTPYMLLLAFLLIIYFNIQYLNDSLILFKDTGNAYMFVLTTLMTFSIDIAFVQYKGTKISDLNLKCYLGIKELDFFCKMYFVIHKFIKSRLFYLFFIYFVLFPCIGYDTFFNKSKNIIIKIFSSIWQTTSLFIIVTLVFLIISDFSIAKYSNYIDNGSDFLEQRLNNHVSFMMQKYLEHDYWLKRKNSKFLQYLNDRYRKSHDSFSQGKILDLSIKTFFGYITYYEKIHKRIRSYIEKLIGKYINIIIDKQRDFPKGDLILFVHKYMNLLGYLYIKYNDNNILLTLTNNINGNYIIPKFIYHYLLYSKKGQFKCEENWNDFCSNVFDSDLVSYILTHKLTDYNNMPGYSTVKFKYNPKGYNDIGKQFIQVNLKKMIVCRLSYISKFINKCDIDNMINDISLVAPSFFKSFIKDLISNKDINKYALPGSRLNYYLKNKYIKTGNK